MRSIFFTLVMIVIYSDVATSSLADKPCHSKYAYPGPDNKLVYREDAQGNRIPDYSYAGYEGAGVKLPAVPVKIVLEPQDGDNTQRIQQALDHVESLPLEANGFRGAVMLEAGRYVIEGKLHINAGGVVLRGEGSGPEETLLLATSREKSEWSGRWSGCLITISGQKDFKEVRNSRQAILNECVNLDQKTFRVQNTETFQAGDRIMVERNTNTAWVQANGMDRIPPRPDGKPVRQWTAGPREAYERTVTAVSDETITIDRPLYNKIQRKYGGGSVYKYTFPGRIQYVGVENLRAVSAWKPQNDTDPLTHLAAMVQIFNAENCWVQDLVGLNFYGTGIYLSSRTRGITVQDCLIKNAKPRFYKSYSYVARYGITSSGQDNLIQRCRAINCRHAFSVGGRVAGANVFLDCDGPSSLGGSEPHHRWSTGTLFDRCGHHHPTPLLIMNRGNMGSGHGWTASNSVMWNCIGDPLTVESPPTTRNYSIGCTGKRKKGPFSETLETEAYDSWDCHVIPDSLYLAQLKDRLGAEAVTNISK